MGYTRINKDDFLRGTSWIASGIVTLYQQSFCDESHESESIPGRLKVNVLCAATLTASGHNQLLRGGASTVARS
jgi:hypothetical protein